MVMMIMIIVLMMDWLTLIIARMIHGQRHMLGLTGTVAVKMVFGSENE